MSLKTKVNEFTFTFQIQLELLLVIKKFIFFLLLFSSRHHDQDPKIDSTYGRPLQKEHEDRGQSFTDDELSIFA